MPHFDHLEKLSDDPLLSLPASVAADRRPHKVNLGIGVYQDAEGKPLLFSSVVSAEKILAEKQMIREYLPIQGYPPFRKESLKLVFGADHIKVEDESIFALQTVGATSALRLGGELLATTAHRTIYVSNPSWTNHKLVFSRAGLKVDSYPYYDIKNHCVDFSGLCASILQMPSGSAILLQACCHNPTGTDLSIEQWKEVEELIRKQKLLPFFDFSYQGFGHDIEQDAFPIRYFADKGHEFLVAYSYSKNFGLYAERVGVFFYISTDPEKTTKVGSHLKHFVRGMYSTPPLHGAAIVASILQSESLYKEWKTELANMRGRIDEMREAFIVSLQAKCPHINVTYMSKQLGMFSFCGLNQKHVEQLKQEYAIYLPSNGRINIAGLNWNNMEYVVEAITAVINA